MTRQRARSASNHRSYGFAFVDYVKQMKNMGIHRYDELHHVAHTRFLNEVRRLPLLGRTFDTGWTRSCVRSLPPAAYD